MVIELLKFQVPLSEQQDYIQTDAVIWTTALAKYPGFLRKEIWISDEIPEELTIVIHWQTREQWKAIPLNDLSRIDANFVQALGKSYPIMASQEYQVWEKSKFTVV
jgi:uncharacterized protein (TIGR03792 family)